MPSSRSEDRCNSGIRREPRVKEGDNDRVELPDRPISPHRNFVTEAALAAIEAALGCAEAAHRAPKDKGDGGAAGAPLRDVRYWRARRASAEVVKPPADKSTASFGMSPSAGSTAASRASGSLVKMRPILRAARSPTGRRSSAALTHGRGRRKATDRERTERWPWSRARTALERQN
jgi:hypothetical protein